MNISYLLLSDGQGIAVRLAKEINNVCTKIQRELKRLNNIAGSTYEYKDLLDPDAECYRRLDKERIQVIAR